MNGFQTFFASGDVGAHTESVQPRDDNSKQQQLHQPLTTAAKCAWRATYWLRTGAMPTCAVLSILCYARVIYGCEIPCLSCGYYHGNAHFFLDDILCRSTMATFSLIIATFVLFRYFVSSKKT